MLYGPGKSRVMFVTRENRIFFWNHPFYKWIAHVVRACDLGSGLVASWAKLLNVLSTCREWDR
jgi:hypothetical protein